AQSGPAWAGGDAFLSLTGTTSDGFRQHEAQENVKFNGNLGMALSDRAETRFYLSGNILNQELPGTVSRSAALNDPKAANAAAVSSDWRRDIRSARLANKTTVALDDNRTVDVGGFVNAKDLFHPISPFVGVIDQNSLDYGAFTQLSGAY